jgi:hypothetical protein
MASFQKIRPSGNYVLSPTEETGIGELDLLASVIRLAVDDARHGDHDAAAWLCQFAPEVVGKLVPVPEAIQGQLWR